MPNIELIAQYMKNHPEANIEIKGYASPEGPKELNQKLSEKRAEAVKNVLVKKYKIAANRLTTKGMGATDKLFNALIRIFSIKHINPQGLCLEDFCCSIGCYFLFL